MPTDADVVDRLTRRRARIMSAMGALFILQQAVYFSQSPSPNIAHVKIGAWLVLTSALLLLLATGGNVFRSAQIRALMNDETTRAHRAHALMLGFWTTMGTGLLLYMLTMFDAFDPRNTIHIMMTVGIATALLSFGLQERRALA